MNATLQSLSGSRPTPQGYWGLVAVYSIVITIYNEGEKLTKLVNLVIENHGP